MADWVPDPNGVAQVLELATLARTPGRHQEAKERLAEYNQISDFNKYLCYAFVFQTSTSEHDRMMIGILLKDNVARHWKTMPPEVQHYIMELGPLVLEDPSLSLREVCGSLISVILAQTTLAGWPTLIENLISVLDNENPNLVQGALRTLSKLCEDHGRALSQVQPNFTHQPTDLLIPKLYELLQSGKPDLMNMALICVSHVIVWQPTALLLTINEFFTILFGIAQNPPSPAVLVTVCKTFDSIVFGKVAAITDHMPDVVQYMLAMTSSDDHQVAMAAANFWITIADVNTQICYGALSPFLTDVVRTLLTHMRFSADELDQLEELSEDISQPDRPENTNPAASKVTMGNDAEAQFDTTLEISEPTLRKACGRGLEELANVFQEDLLEVIIPMIQAGLQSEDWLDREASILALGATAPSFLDVGEEHLGGIVPMLLELLDNDPRVLIRRIAAWTVSRYVTWIAKDSELLHLAVSTLNNRLSDRSKYVLDWVLQAFAILSEAAEEKMRGYFEDLLQTFMQLFHVLQGRSFNKVLDAIGSLAHAVAGEALNQAHVLELLMPPLMERWNALDEHTDERLFAALYDVVTRVGITLGVAFAPWAPTVWEKSVHVLQNHVMLSALHKQSPETVDPPSNKQVVCALENMSTITEALKAGAADLIAESNVIPLLVEVLQETSVDVTRASLGFVGDIAASCYALLEPALEHVLPVVIGNLRPRYHTSIPINAAWALKEIIDRAGEPMAPYVEGIATSAINIMHDPNQHEQLHQNAAILVSAIAIHFPLVVATDLQNFIGQWCLLLASLEEDEDKKTSFFGLLSAIRANPEAVIPEFHKFAYAVASWGVPSNSLRQAFIDIFAAYQQQLAPEVWDHVLKTINDDDLSVLQQWYM